jgi:hypothetical protein
MKFWALRMISIFLKALAVVLAVLGGAVGLLAMLSGTVSPDVLSRSGVAVGNVSAAALVLSLCSCLLWLGFAFGLYASAQFIDLLVELERNQRRIINKLP